jgi:hypothetical protein
VAKINNEPITEESDFYQQALKEKDLVGIISDFHWHSSGL